LHAHVLLFLALCFGPVILLEGKQDLSCIVTIIWEYPAIIPARAAERKDIWALHRLLGVVWWLPASLGPCCALRPPFRYFAWYAGSLTAHSSPGHCSLRLPALSPCPLPLPARSSRHAPAAEWGWDGL